MAEKKFTVSMDVENIGPHYGVNKLTFSEAVDSNKAIFYATNGTGKSFISIPIIDHDYSLMVRKTFCFLSQMYTEN